MLRCRLDDIEINVHISCHRRCNRIITITNVLLIIFKGISVSGAKFNQRHGWLPVMGLYTIWDLCHAVFFRKRVDLQTLFIHGEKMSLHLKDKIKSFILTALGDFDQIHRKSYVVQTKSRAIRPHQSIRKERATVTRLHAKCKIPHSNMQKDIFEFHCEVRGDNNTLIVG